MAVNRGRALCAAARLVTDENLDLYVLAGAALTFTVLGFTGVSNVSVLTSAVLVLLATLALSRIRSRRHVAPSPRRTVRTRWRYCRKLSRRN